MYDLSWLDPFVAALVTPVGALLFVPLYAIWVTLLLPGVWACMLAGVLYGTGLGSLLVFSGACLAAEVVFLLGRSHLRSWARQRLARMPRILALERAVSREGVKLVLLTRLSPAFPFSLLNLTYSLSGVRRRDYSLGHLAFLPGTILFCALGDVAGDVSRFAAVLSEPAEGTNWTLRWVGLAATVATVWFCGRVTRRALRAQPLAADA